VREPESWCQPDLGLDKCGRANPWYYEMNEPAPNYPMRDLNAALRKGQLSKLASFIARRAELARRYDELLADMAPIVLPPVRQPGPEAGWHLYSVRIDFASLSMDRAELMTRLRDAGIGTQVHYIPVPWQPYWAKKGWR